MKKLALGLVLIISTFLCVVYGVDGVSRDQQQRISSEPSLQGSTDSEQEEIRRAATLLVGLKHWNTNKSPQLVPPVTQKEPGSKSPLSERQILGLEKPSEIQPPPTGQRHGSAPFLQPPQASSGVHEGPMVGVFNDFQQTNPVPSKQIPAGQNAKSTKRKSEDESDFPEASRQVNRKVDKSPLANQKQFTRPRSKSSSLWFNAGKQLTPEERQRIKVTLDGFIKRQDGWKIRFDRIFQEVQTTALHPMVPLHSDFTSPADKLMDIVSGMVNPWKSYLDNYVTHISGVFHGMDNLLEDFQTTVYSSNASILFVYIDTRDAQMKSAIVDFNLSHSSSQILEEIDGMFPFVVHSVVDTSDRQSYADLNKRIQNYSRTNKALLNQVVGYYHSMVYNMEQSGI